MLFCMAIELLIGMISIAKPSVFDAVIGGRGGVRVRWWLVVVCYKISVVYDLVHL